MAKRREREFVGESGGGGGGKARSVGRGGGGVWGGGGGGGRRRWSQRKLHRQLCQEAKLQLQLS